MTQRLPSLSVPTLAPRLRAAGYTADTLQRLLHIAVPDDVGLLNHAPALHRAAAADGSAAATLVRLFFLEADEPYRRVAAALTRRGCDDLVATGLLQRRGPVLRARLRIDPVGEQYIIADRRFRASGRNPVYPPSSDSLLLRDAIGAAGAQRTLDLCTGSGIQALHLAAHAERVTAVDINPRAAAVTRLNAQLNGIGNLDVLVGDLYAPVRAQQFDLIIANPPFVSSPYETGPAYHSGGPTGDRVLRRIIAGFGTHLRPSGRAFAISHVGLRAGEDLPAVAGRWFSNFPGRALVLLLESGTSVDLAAAQALFALRRGLASYAAEVTRWVSYLQRHRIERVALILVVAERSDRRGLDVVEASSRVLPIPLTPPPTERIAKWLRAELA